MSTVVQVAIHESQFPGNIHRDLVQSLRTRQVNHKFHYDSHKQTQQWLKLHQAYSPSRTDAECAGIYDRSFSELAPQLVSKKIHLVGLGCGGGQKDTRLLRLLKAAGKSISYAPVDVSVAMVLVAQQAATAVVSEKDVHPLACDLMTSDDLGDTSPLQCDQETARVITFFGMIPNFEPQIILPKLAALLRPDDSLLFSANLAPGPDYAAGVAKILPLYDNALTRDWLQTFLLDLGVTVEDGAVRFAIEDCPAGTGLKRVATYFHFTREREIAIDGETFRFAPGESIRLFFSYRHTPAKIKTLLQQHGIGVQSEWITASQEEGVFLCRRQ
jgi:L-histidine N-alpha-methyltransferase